MKIYRKRQGHKSGVTICSNLAAVKPEWNIMNIMTLNILTKLEQSNETNETGLLPAMQAHYITFTHFLSESQMQHLTLQDQYFFIFAFSALKLLAGPSGRASSM